MKPTPLPFVKGLIVILLVLLTVQIYHHRQWFKNIPEKSGAAQAPAKPPAPAPPLPATLPSAPKSGVLKKLTTLLPGAKNTDGADSILQNTRFDSLWTALGAVKKTLRRTPGDSGRVVVDERVDVPRGKPLPEYALSVNRLVEAAAWRIEDAYEEAKDSSMVILISGTGKIVRKIKLVYGPGFLPGSARAALVLEGFGSALTPSLQALFSAVKFPVTIGVVPKTRFAGQIARMARQNGWEIVCQIPMESVPFQNLGPDAIYKHYDAKKVQEILVEFQRDLPSFDGYSIYERGIRIVENEPEILKTLLKHARSEKRFFIDNSFAIRSRVPEFAKSLNVNAAAPLGYIDQLPGLDNHVKAARRFAQYIRKTGTGILLFKNGDRAAESLKKIMPLLDELGIQPVFVSSLYQ